MGEDIYNIYIYIHLTGGLYSITKRSLTNQYEKEAQANRETIKMLGRQMAGTG